MGHNRRNGVLQNCQYNVNILSEYVIETRSFVYMTHGCNEPSEKLIQVYFCISIFTWNISKFLKLRCYSNFLLIINWAQSIIGSESQCSKGDSCSNWFLDSNWHQFKGQSVLEYWVSGLLGVYVNWKISEFFKLMLARRHSEPIKDWL